MNSTQKVIKYLAIAFAACLTITILATVLNIGISICENFIPENQDKMAQSSSIDTDSNDIVNDDDVSDDKISNDSSSDDASDSDNNTEGDTSDDEDTNVQNSSSDEDIDSEDVFEDVENLKIESSIYKVSIEKDSTIEGVRVTCSNIPSTYKIIYDEDKKLLKTRDDNWVSSLFNKSRNSSKGEVIIYVSDKADLEDVNIEMGIGSVKISDIQMELLKVDCGVGVFACENVQAEEAEIKGGVGNVDCDDVIFDGLELEGGVGDVDVSGILTGKTEVSAGMGNVKLDVTGEKEDYNIKVETGLGAIYVDGEKYSDSSYNNSQSNLIDIEGGIGSIHVDFN